jgi:hypothetical protein
MPPNSDAGHLGIEILNSARRWARLRVRLRMLLDSKAATPQQVEKVRVAYNKESHELELKVGKLERLLILSGQNVSVARRSQNPIPWNQLFALLAKVGAEGLNGALNGVPPAAPPQPPPVQSQKKPDDDYIDAEIED